MKPRSVPELERWAVMLGTLGSTVNITGSKLA